MSTPAPSTPPRESPAPSPPGSEGLGISAGPPCRLDPTEETGQVFVTDVELAGRLGAERDSHDIPSRRKLDFHAEINTREILPIDREPWSLGLYRLADGRLRLVGVSTVDDPIPLAGEVLPLAFRLLPGEERPTLEFAQVGGEQVWRI